jgi:hypothetical protein
MTDPQRSEKLTPAQVENWRNILLGMIGPYALMMPEEDVQALRDKLQEHVSRGGTDDR